MKQEADELIREEAAEDFSEEESLTNWQYLGNYLQVAKPDGLTSYNNCFYLTYKMSYRNDFRGANYTLDYYDCVIFHDVTLEGDGNLDWDRGEVNTTVFFTDVKNSWGGNYYLCGFRTEKDMFDYYLTRRLGNYTYETNIQ